MEKKAEARTAAKRTAPKSIDAYLATQPKEARALLDKLRAMIRAAAPAAEETISYQMPAFRYRGKGMVGFAGFKEHCSFFPMSVAVMDAHDAELRGYRTSKGTVQFTAEKPLPAALVKKLVRARMREIDAKS